MAEQSGFFNANLINGTYDRVYLAESFAKYFANFIGNGIFGGNLNELMVNPATSPGMKIEIFSGMGWINGYWYENTGTVSLDIDVADGVLNRIDCVVLRWSKSERNIKVAIKKGAFSSTAVAPSLQRDADVYELKLAEIHVKAGTVNITQSNITDTRFDKNVCGLVTGLIDQVDVTKFMGLMNSAFGEVEARTKDSINRIVDRLNALLEDKSAFANLVLKVDDIVNENALTKQTLGYTKKNLIPYPFKNSYTQEYTLNGITFINNGDGTVTANGTAEVNTYYTIYKGKPFAVGKFLVNSGVDVNTNFAYIRFVDKKTSVEIPNTTYYGHSKTPIQITESDMEAYDLFVGIAIMKGTTVNNLVFKPMVRRAEIIDSVWEPYQMNVSDSINIANIPGIEYRLAEKWNDKPIYQKTFYVASLPNNTVMSIGTGTEWNKVVSVDGYALDKDDLTYYPFPVIPHNQITPIAVISRVESDGYIVIVTNADATYLEAYVTIKYVK